MPDARTPARAPGPDGAQAEERLDLLPCGVVSFTDEGTIVATNATLLGMLGYERGEVEGRHVEMLFALASRIFFQTHLYPLIRLHDRAEEMFVLLRRKDGADVGALLNGARREHDGRAVNDCVLMEVRERRKFEDALLEAKRTAESARAALEARTRDLEAANATLSRQARELELQQQQLEDQATELETQGEELRTINEDLLARTEELEEARTVAEEANRAKSQFLAVMSHELRTPLNAIGGYVQLLGLGIHGPVTDAQRDALDRIARSQRHLLALINDILNLARIEAGRLEYSLEEISLAGVVAGVTPMLEPQMAAAGLTLSTSVAPDLVARADREKVQQILINLLTNAVKFTPAGGRITVAAGRDAGEDAAPRVLVDVSDTGIGIAAGKLESIFEPFVQVDARRTGRSEGTGLGLAISRDLARGMGGDLRVRSEVGRGTTFTLVLPGA